MTDVIKKPGHNLTSTWELLLTENLVLGSHLCRSYTGAMLQLCLLQVLYFSIPDTSPVPLA